ncbi:MAG: signal peptide peptidase SppA [Myxococcales bacterium]|nr:signal peptide peptidase SppA [Myxococcales bacterium]
MPWLLVRVLLSLLLMPLFALRWLRRCLLRPPRGWVRLRVQPRLVELAVPGPLPAWIPLPRTATSTSVHAIRDLARRIARDPRIDGLLVELPRLRAGWAAALGLRSALAHLRSTGKPTAVLLPEGGGNLELLVASAAERILLPPQASLVPLGLLIERPYVGPVLERLGVRVDRMHRGAYKTAAESLERAEMSAPEREQLGRLLEVHRELLHRALAERIGGNDERVAQLLDAGWLDPDAAAALGLRLEAAYPDELPDRLGREGAPARFVEAPAYLRWHASLRHLAPWPRRVIAVVPLHGVIVDRAPVPGRRIVDARSLGALLEALADSPQAAGVILHVESPGGSALGSDLIARQVRRLGARKPVVACLGNVAASGGYLVASAATRIVAAPSTITGSIGVIALRPSIHGLLERIGVRNESLQHGANAALFSPSRALDESGRALFERRLDVFYRAFIAAVAAGRNRPEAEVEAVAAGRIWAGTDAADRGLVDRLGGLHEACEEVRHLLRERGMHGVEALEPVAIRPPAPTGSWLPWLATASVPQWAEELVVLRALGPQPLFFAPDVVHVH